MKRIIVSLFCIFMFLNVYAQKITVKIASVAPSRSPWEVEQKNLALEWSKITGGKVNLQFYSADALGSEKGVIQKMNSVRPGQRSPINGAILTSIGVFELAPESKVLTFSVPYLFRNQDELTYILEKYSGEIDKSLDEKGFMLMGWFNVGWANFLTKEEVRTPEKLKALKLSVGGFTSPELGRAFQRAGYLTDDVSNEKILSSIKSANGVKGLYTIPMYAYATQYFKGLTYVIESPLCPVMAAFIISKSTWNSIPDEYKPALKAAVEKAEAKFIGVQQKNDSDYLKLMERDGATLVKLTPEEIALWEKSLSKDAHDMSTDPNIRVIDFDFFSRIEADLKAYRVNKK